MRPLRLVHMVAAIGHEASGPSYSVPRLCQALAQRGHDVELHVLDWEATPSVPEVGLRLYPPLPLPGSLMFSLAMGRGLRAAARTADVVHTHGLWMVANLQAATAAARSGRRLVTSPRGSFASWAMEHSKWRKRALWALAQRRAVTATSLFHATSNTECADIRRMGLTAPVAVIPNGVDIPTPVRPRAGTRRRLLFLGRLHPVKGLDLLLRAWAKLEPRHPEWDLEIVGRPAGDHGAALVELARTLDLKRTSFSGALYGQAKADAYARAELYVLPTHTENFGMTVAEALASGIPAIVTRGAPWAGLESERCGWWIERTEAELTASLTRAMTLDREQLCEMGARGRAWMVRDFSWNAIAERMESAYRWLSDPTGAAPSSFHR